jgi:hypothetical protein
MVQMLEHLPASMRSQVQTPVPPENKKRKKRKKEKRFG